MRTVRPLHMRAVATLGLISVIASWNNFIGPSTAMRSPALRSLQRPVSTEWGVLMAPAAPLYAPMIQRLPEIRHPNDHAHVR
jgi:multiple sugar transport system permease protein